MRLRIFHHPTILLFSCVLRNRDIRIRRRQSRRSSNLSWLANLVLPALCSLPPMRAVRRRSAWQSRSTAYPRTPGCPRSRSESISRNDSCVRAHQPKIGVKYLGGARMCPPHPRHQLSTLRRPCDWRAPSELRALAALAASPPHPESGAYSALVSHVRTQGCLVSHALPQPGVWIQQYPRNFT